MKEKCYFHDNEVILNFTHQPPGSTTQLLDSDFFNTFLEQYLDYLDTHRRDLKEYLYAGNVDRAQVLNKLKGTLRILLLMHTNTVEMPYFALPEILELSGKILYFIPAES